MGITLSVHSRKDASPEHNDVMLHSLVQRQGAPLLCSANQTPVQVDLWVRFIKQCKLKVVKVI